jgi:PAS domain S-box-containing protein
MLEIRADVDGSSTSRSTSPPGRATASILIVGSRASDREFRAMILGLAGHSVLEAPTAEAGLALALSQRPDLVITDVMMPTADGYDLVRALRSDVRTKTIPVVFSTSGYALSEVRRLAAACGVTHLFVKPFEPGEILRVVGSALGSTDEPPAPLGTEEFQREHLQLLNSKLIETAHALAASEAQAAESVTLLETLQSTAPVGFGFVDRNCRIRQMNDTLAEIYGVSAQDQLGRTLSDAVPEVWAKLEPLLHEVVQKGEAVLNRRVTRTVPGPPADTRFELTSYYPVSVQGEIIGVGVVVVDITEQQHSQELRSVVMETMAEGLYVLDEQDRLLLMNQAASEMLGWSEDELRGKPLHPVIHFQHADRSPYAEDDCEILEVRRERRTIRTFDDAFTRKDGTILPVATSAAPLLNETNVRGTVVVFRDITEEKEAQARLQRELNALTWVGHIRDALDEDRLVLYSQPIIPLSGGPHGEELLLRMVGRAAEIIPPQTFLPTAEKYGLIAEIDRWVIEQAVALAAEGRRVNVNVSAESVESPDLLGTIRRCVEAAGADPANLVFEITETGLMRDAPAGMAFARGIADLGSSLALDDFGTGFGSFTHLKTLPIRYLKIDIEFVRELIPVPANQHVVKAIVSLAEGFDCQTVAEGVEDEATLALLREYGVDFAQGYHLGRPAPMKGQAGSGRAQDSPV